MKHFPDLTDELHTDKEILAAIYKLANKDETEARKIWDSPTHDELCQIIHWVTVKGGCTTDYCWGASGNRWANGITVLYR
jgi:hypothetical protein